MKPIIYSCCEDKSEEGYPVLLESLRTYTAKKNIVLNPSTILIDFEQAMVNACPSELSCKQDLGQDTRYRNVSRS